MTYIKEKPRKVEIRAFASGKLTKYLGIRSLLEDYAQVLNKLKLKRYDLSKMIENLRKNQFYANKGLIFKLDHSENCIDIFGIESKTKPLFSIEVQKESLADYINALRDKNDQTEQD